MPPYIFLSSVLSFILSRLTMRSLFVPVWKREPGAFSSREPGQNRSLGRISRILHVPWPVLATNRCFGCGAGNRFPFSISRVLDTDEDHGIGISQRLFWPSSDSARVQSSPLERRDPGWLSIIQKLRRSFRLGRIAG